jgi:hypothetical protein
MKRESTKISGNAPVFLRRKQKKQRTFLEILPETVEVTPFELQAHRA